MVIAVAAILWHLRAFLPPFTLPARGDPSLPFQGSDLTPQWGAWLRVAIDSVWRHATLPFWNPFANAGMPVFDAPQAGVVSLTTLLGVLLPLEAAIKWALLAHIVAGMAGVYAFSQRLGVRSVLAAVGAFSFGIGTYLLDHFRAGHVSDTLAMCLAPWVMFLVWKALVDPERWWRPAIAAGMLIGLEILEGGSSVVVYTAIALSLLAVTCVGPGWRSWVIHVGRVGVVAAVCAFATAAPQMLPMLAYVGLTGTAKAFRSRVRPCTSQEVAHPMPTVAAMVIMCVGVVWLWKNGRWRAALWIAAVIAFAAAAASRGPLLRTSLALCSRAFATSGFLSARWFSSAFLVRS